MWLGGMNMELVREDIMWINILHAYNQPEPSEVFLNGIQHTFTNDYPWISWPYRPIEHLLIPTQLNILHENIPILILIKSSILGINAVLLYLITINLTGKKYTSICATLLFSFSIPTILETWWFHHMQIWLELFILVGIFSYLQYVRSKRFTWLAVLWSVSLLAPWFEEAAFSLPIIILLVTIADKRKDWKLLLSMTFFTIHGLFTQLWVNLAVYQKVNIISIFDTFVGGLVKNEGFFQSVQVSTPYSILDSVTPILTIISFITVGIYLVSKKQIMYFIILAILLICFIALVLNYPPFPPQQSITTLNFLSSLFPLLFAFISFRFNKIVPIWFCVSYIPFLRIQHLNVNLIPTIVPWTLLISLWLVETVIIVRSRTEKNSKHRTKWNNPLFVTLAIVIFIGFASQISNIDFVEQTWIESAKTTKAIGTYMYEHVPRGSIVYGDGGNSFFNTVDLPYYTNYTINSIVVKDWDWTVQYPTPVIHINELDNELETKSEQNVNTYMLFGSIQNTPEPVRKYVKEHLPKFSFVKEFKTVSKTINIDPVLFLFPPDYRLHTMVGFLELEVENSTSTQITFGKKYELYSTILPKLITKYNGFLIYKYGDEFFAIPEDEAKFSISNFRNSVYTKSYDSKSIEDILEKIDLQLSTPNVDHIYKGFQILVYDGVFYAIPKNELFDQSRCMPSGYSFCISDKSIQNLKNRLDVNLETKFVESYGNFNILFNNDVYYAVQQGEGYFEVEQFEKGSYSISLKHNSASELKKLIDLVR